MRHVFRLMFILPVFVLMFLPNISLSAKSQKTALVIGNGSYSSSPLRNPVNDATDITSMLKKLGFKVILKTNANQRTMEKSIRNFGKKLRNGGVGLFYYAGHAMQVHGANYLIPISAQIESESDVKYEAIDAGRVLGKMEDAGNGLNIIILDACRDNPFARSFRTSEKGLARMDAPTGSILAYATAPGSIADDGTDRNGLYTSKLLKHMATPGLEIEKVFKKVRIDVLRSSQKKQVPWESSSLIGEFYFNPKRGIAVVKSTKKVDTGLKAEQERLEKERKELARIEAEIEERKRVEAERKRIEAKKKKLLAMSKRPPKAVTTPKGSLNIYKLGLLPINYVNYNEDYVFCEVVTGLIKTYKNINLKLSFYKKKDEISDDVVFIDNKGMKKKIWKKESFWSSSKPDISFIISYSKKMDIDIVLLYSSSISNGPDWITAYLIDINKEKIYKETVITQTFDEEGYDAVWVLTKKMFDSFLNK